MSDDVRRSTTSGRRVFVEKISALLAAMQAVEEAWPTGDDGPVSQGYPFSTCFTEMQSAVCDWRDAQDELVLREEIQRTVRSAAKAASAQFIKRMADPWPDPDNLLTTLWDETVRGLSDDLDAATDSAEHMSWPDLELLWRNEVKRIYDIWSNA
jgi:hypothetical protein